MPIEIIYEVQDRSGSKATTSVQVPSNHVVTTLTGFAVAWANNIDDLMDGVIRTATAYLRMALSGLTSNTIASTSDVEHYGKFEFLTSNGNRVKINIPALNEVAILAYDSDDLNQGEPDVAAFIAAMEVGIAVTGGTITPCDIAEDDITDVVFAREAFSNSGSHR